MRLQKLWNPVWERYSRLKAQDINTYKRLVGITVLFLLLYVAAWVSAGNGWQIAAGGSLGLTGFLLAVLFYRESRWILDSRVLLSLFWLGGEGVAAFTFADTMDHTDMDCLWSVLPDFFVGQTRGGTVVFGAQE